MVSYGLLTSSWLPTFVTRHCCGRHWKLGRETHRFFSRRISLIIAFVVSDHLPSQLFLHKIIGQIPQSGLKLRAVGARFLGLGVLWRVVR